MELKTLNNLFTERIYRIPSYQRGYSWKNNKKIDTKKEDPFKDINGQIKDLWDDIQNILGNNHWHYTGLITLIKSHSDKVNENDKWLLDENFKQYYIVDGQQRITTLIIMIQCIIEKAERLNAKISEDNIESLKNKYIFNKSTLYDDRESFIFGYEKDKSSDNFFKKTILEKNDVIVDDSEENTYTENLKKAKDFFNTVIDMYINKHLKDKKTIKEISIRKLFKTITNKLRFNEYILPDELNEFVVFETMNNRGKPLSELEKLKNRLMFLASKINDPDNKQNEKLRNEINIAWNSIYMSLGRDKNDPLDDEDFVKNHWIMYFGKYSRAEARVYSNYLFNEYFTIQRIYSGHLTYDNIHGYILSLQSSAKIWNKIHHTKYFENDESTIQEKIQSLHRVGMKASFKPLIMACLLKDSKSDYIALFDLLEEYSFKIFDVSDRQSNTGDSKIYRLAYDVYEGTKFAEQVASEISYHMNAYYSFDLFKSQIIELFETGDKKGYYNWSGFKYFLFEYDKFLRMKNNIDDLNSKIDWKRFSENYGSIEHIFPQSVTLSKDDFLKPYIKKGKEEVGLKVYEKIRKNWANFDEYSIEEKIRCCGSLGNLLALSIPKNASLQNDSFKEKVDQSIKGPEYNHKGYRYGSYSEQLVANYNDWTPETILDRGIDMLDFLWEKLHPEELNPLSKSDKTEILGLEFLLKHLME